MLDFLAGRPLPLLFLKAVQKKQIYVPAFVRADGVAVAGHMKWVHVADDHDDHKVAHGQGSHSQKVAHGKLVKHDWFHALPTGDKAAIVMAHATDHQAMDSANARASTLRSKILKGEKPTAGEWRAWGYIDADKRQKLYDEITEAGKGPVFQQYMDGAEVTAGMNAQKERLEHQPASVTEIQHAEHPKEEPAAAAPPAPEPKAEEPAKPESPKEPESAQSGAGEEKAAFMAKLQAAALPPENVNASSFNLKLKLIQQAFEAGDAKLLLGMSYGTNTYGKKAAKLVNDALAVLGHEHKVEPGQKAGAHPALAGDVAPKQSAAEPVKEEPKDEPKPDAPAAEPQPAAPAQPEKAAPAAAAEELKTGAVLEFDSQYEKMNAGKWTVYNTMGDLVMMHKVGAKVPNQTNTVQIPAATLAEAIGKGTAKVLESAPAAPATPEPAATAAAPEPPAAGALAMPTFDGGKIGATVTEYYEAKAKQIIDMAAAGDVAGLEKMKADFLKPKAGGSLSKTFAGKTPNSKILIALHDAALAQAKGGAASAPAAAADAGPKEGDTKPAADGGTLVLKDGHWIKQDEPQAAVEQGPHAELMGQVKAAGFEVKSSGLHGVVLASHDGILMKQYANKTQAEQAVQALSQNGFDAHVIGQHPFAVKITGKKADPVPLKPAAPASLTAEEVGEKPNGINTNYFTIAKNHALAGDLEKLQAAQKEADDIGLVNTANHIGGMIDALKAKQGSAPAAKPSPVPAEFKDNFPVKNFILTMKMAHKHAAALGDVSEWIDPEDMGGYEALSATDKVKVHAAVAAISPEAKASMKKWLAWHDKKLSAPAAALAEHEIPDYPLQVDADYGEKAKKFAAAGDVAGLQAMIDEISGGGYPSTTAYAQHLLNKMSENAASGAPAPTGNPALDDPAADGEAGAAAEQGPKDGDTKPGANGGTLVFQNGRWHKQGDDPKVLKQKAASVPLPKLSGTNAVKMSKVAKALKEIAETQGAEGLSKVVQQSQPTGAKTVMAAGGYKFSISNDPDVASSNGTKLANYAKALQAAMAGTQGAAPAAPKVVASAAASSAPDAAVPMDSWSKVGAQKGFNDGGFFKDPSGQEWYCKFPAGGESVIKNELLANKLTGLAGLSVPDLQLVKKGGQLGLASKIIPGAQENKAALLEGKAEGLLESFAVHAWLANWDSVGSNPAKGFDNILIDAAGKAHHIDQGGALAYGGAGGAKGQFGEKVIELKTMLDAGKNANTAAVFGKMSPADIAASVKKVAMISDDAILSYCMKYGPGDNAAKQAMAAKLIARKKDMLAQFPKAAKATHGTGANPDDLSWVKLNPGEKIVEHGTKFGASWAKIEIPAHGFNAEGIPKPFVYDKSSSQFVNAANTADIKSVYDTALAAKDPAAVLGLQYPEIVKATGEKTGKMLTIDEHPSKAYVKEYVNQVAAELGAQLKPTYKVEHRGSFSAGYSAAAAEIAALVKPISHANFKHWANKAADYLVLDKDAGAGVPAPEPGMFSDVEPSDPKMVAFKKASDDKYATLTSGEKSACVAYTGSAYVNWNSAMRLGTVDSAEFKAGEPMRKAFAKAAVELPEGIILHRGIGVGGDTYKSVVGAVLQDGSFQSCSYGTKAAFSGHQSQLRLHISKGVKGMMATSFSKFGSGERELILHPNCRYVVMGVKNEGGKHMVDILVLPHEE